MRKMAGFILFWIAIGMTIMLFLDNGIIAVLIILLCLISMYILKLNVIQIMWFWQFQYLTGLCTHLSG